MTFFSHSLRAILFLIAVLTVVPVGALELDGAGVMEEVFQRHRIAPYVYEEQTMVLLDGRGDGEERTRDVRHLRRYTRANGDGSLKHMMIFDRPEEIRGSGFLIHKSPDGEARATLYLPALKKKFQSVAQGGGRGGRFMGTDFALEDLVGEDPAAFRYVRAEDLQSDEIDYFVIDVFPQTERAKRMSAYGRRRHLVRRDNFYIARTDYFDRSDRFVKTRTHHNMKQVKGDLWRAESILMDHPGANHKSLIRVERRVFSPAYVPDHIFTRAWLAQNRLYDPDRLPPPSPPGSAARVPAE